MYVTKESFFNVFVFEMQSQSLRAASLRAKLGFAIQFTQLHSL